MEGKVWMTCAKEDAWGAFTSGSTVVGPANEAPIDAAEWPNSNGSFSCNGDHVSCAIGDSTTNVTTPEGDTATTWLAEDL